jgi:ABC-type multidrug transport system ATPase subunit
VRETLKYTALLKLPASMSKAEKLAKVETVIQELRLSHRGDTIIGDQFTRGVSGGEKRRVSVALQLLTNPSKCACNTTVIQCFVRLPLLLLSCTDVDVVQAFYS